MLVLVTRDCESLFLGWTSKFNASGAEEACEDNLYNPQLDQGNKEVIRVAVLLLFNKVRSNRLLNIINLILHSDD